MTKAKILLPIPNDDYCMQVLLILMIRGEKIRFNNLLKLLADVGVKGTKPTLSQHLKHLTQKKLVKRNVEDVQKVSYEINHKTFSNFEKRLKPIFSRVEEFTRTKVEEEQAFHSASIDDQMKNVLDAMILRNLRQLKTRIELRSNPVRNWEKSMELMLLSSPFFMHHEEWLTEKCVREKEFKEKIFQKIDEKIKEIEDQNHGSH